jgi:hypothetical protein
VLVDERLTHLAAAFPRNLDRTTFVPAAIREGVAETSDGLRTLIAARGAPRDSMSAKVIFKTKAAERCHPSEPPPTDEPR